MARDFTDLVCWRLAQTLRDEVCALTETGPAARDFRFCDQIRDSSASATRNIAEGFGKFTPREFARFLRIAKGSLAETRNHLEDGRRRGYLDQQLCDRLSNLARAAARLTTNLMLAKLRQAEEEDESKRRKRPSRHRPDT